MTRLLRWLKRYLWHEEVPKLTDPTVAYDRQLEFLRDELAPTTLKEWDDDRHVDALNREPGAPIIEPSVPEGMTYAPTKLLPTTRASLCIEDCRRRTSGEQERTCPVGCQQLAEEMAVLPLKEANELLEQAFGEAEKRIVYPTPVDDMSVREWVDWRIGYGSLNPDSLNRTVDSDGSLVARGIRYEVRRGFSMSYLSEIARRAHRKDMTLTLDQLAAARSRGLI